LAQSLIEMVTVNGGSFVMGCGSGQNNCSDIEKPIHTVTLNSYYISKYEVTQSQYQQVTGSNPSYFTGDLQKPIEQINWYHTLVFCNKLSIMESLTPVYSISGSTNPNNWGTVPTSFNSIWETVVCNWSANGYRLPTEAEWEYAARGGSNYTNFYTYSGSNIISEVAWYSNISGNSTKPVGTKNANQLGIYDMTGNIEEWCWDWYDSNYYSISPTSNPKGPSTGLYRIYRGGDFLYTNSNNGGVSIRTDNFDYPFNNNNYVGFRVVRNF
jgi:formylglycine-generating enzyme required for sulfatase activity